MTRWLKTTDDILPAPRAKRPNAADAKIILPPTTRMDINKTNGLSTCPRFIQRIVAPSTDWLESGQGCEREQYPRKRKDDGKNPIPHHNFRPRPADSLKVMVQWSDSKKL